MENIFLMSDQKFLRLLPLFFLLCTSEQSLAPSPLQCCCRQLKQIARRNIIIHTKPEFYYKPKIFNYYNELSSFGETVLKNTKRDEN